MARATSERPAHSPLTGERIVRWLAVAGAVEAAWLLLAERTAGGCLADGGGCAALLRLPALRWFGLPVAAWGLCAYGTLAALLARPVRDRAGPAAAALASAMALASTFLLAVMLERGGLCAFCCASAALSCAAAALLSRAVVPGRRHVVWAGGAVLVGSLLLGDAVVRPSGQAAQQLSPEVAHQRAALAEHLRATGARFYGAFWCPDCARQKDLFGEAKDRLPYIECTGGTGRADVDVLPSWEIDGQLLPGIQTIAVLAARSGFRGSGD